MTVEQPASPMRAAIVSGARHLADFFTLSFAGMTTRVKTLAGYYKIGIAALL